jgi:hypothetical protein
METIHTNGNPGWGFGTANEDSKYYAFFLGRGCRNGKLKLRDKAIG